MTEAAQPFDPVAVWNGLSPDRQHAIGVAALVAIAGMRGVERGASPPQAFAAAAVHGGDRLIALGVAALVWSGAAARRPDLAAIGVRACQRCGCTDACACPEGCHWVGERMCSACAMPPSTIDAPE